MYIPITALSSPTAMDNTNQESSKEEREKEASKEPTPGPKEDGETKCPAPTPTTSVPPPSPPSSTASPSHEFSFTISLHPSPNHHTASTIKYNKTTPSFAIDLAPADDIFFHGHLVPLHLLSQPAISPRPSSDISIENLSLPLEHIDIEPNPIQLTRNHNHNTNYHETKERSKLKSFPSLLFGKWLKRGDGGEKEEDKKERKKGFDIVRILKKYVNAVEPFFLSFKGEKERRDLRRRPNSFSVSSNPRKWEGRRKRRGEISAPASMRTSPTNSGLLVPTSTTFSSSDESTMEELQNAIQAAIVHCKSSIAKRSSSVDDN